MVDVADGLGAAAVLLQLYVDVAGTVIVPFYGSSVSASTAAPACHILVRAECAGCRSVSFLDVVCPDLED